MLAVVTGLFIKYILNIVYYTTSICERRRFNSFLFYSRNRMKYAALSFSRNLSVNSSSDTTVQYCPETSHDSEDISFSPNGYILSNNSSQPEWRSNYCGDYKDQNLKPICTQDLLSWAFQVARGMEYLSQRKVSYLFYILSM